MKKTLLLILIICFMMSAATFSNASIHYHKEEKSFIWWVANDIYFDALSGICSSTIFEDYTLSGYPPFMESTSRSTFAMIDWHYDNNIYVLGDSKIRYYTGSTNVFDLSLYRDYDVLVSPSWVWQSYRSENDYSRGVSSGLTAKTISSFTVLEALYPSCIVNNEMTIY